MKLLLPLIAGAVLLGGTTVFAETVEIKDRHFFHTHINKVTVHDKTIDTHANVKDADELKINVGVEAENVLKNLPFGSRLDVGYKKDVKNTNWDEGHQVDFIVVKRFEGIDASFLNPFNWFKKGNLE